ncbi:survival motor neuron protein-like protein [Tanacetum coccineum]
MRKNDPHGEVDEALHECRKIMHLKEGDNGSPKEEKITKDTEENVHNVLDESNEPKSPHVETDDNITDIPKDTTISVSEKSTSEVVEQHVNPSNGDQVQEADGTDTNTEYAEQYNVLLNQYNAVEEQRQKLLQQLYQYGNWDYQGYGYGSAYDSQYQTVPAPQTSEPLVCSCRPYVCPYSTAAVSSPETCVASTALAHNGNSVSLKDDDFIESAMGAVNRALCSFKKETSEGKKGEKLETDSGEIVQDKSSQTDLSAVLNAWFSAGFYTGKYLSEQASAKN